MMAIAISMTVAAIGFVGIQGFSRAIARAKQFTAETQLITAALTYAVMDADGQTSLSASAFTTLPQGWPGLGFAPITADQSVRLTFQHGSNKSDFIGRTNDPNVSVDTHNVYISTIPKR
jgi:hypothetical protein